MKLPCMTANEQSWTLLLKVQLFKSLLEEIFTKQHHYPPGKDICNIEKYQNVLLILLLPLPLLCLPGRAFLWGAKRGTSAVGTQCLVEALITLRANRKAHLLAKPHHQEIGVAPQVLGHPVLQGNAGFLWGLGGVPGPTQPVADAVNMCVYTCTTITTSDEH